MTVEIQSRIASAEQRYGKFTSTHEALGVASEEWDELREAVKSNNMTKIKSECLDLAAVLIRLAGQLESDAQLQERSGK